MSALAAREAPQDSLAEAMDALPLGRLHYTLFALICLGFIFETVELIMTSVFGTIFTPQVKTGAVTAMEVSMLLGSAGVGAMLGSPLMGGLADRWGRQRIISAAMVLVGLFSLLGALTSSIDALIVTRVFASVGIGCFVPLAITFLSEMFPARVRGRAVAATTLVAGVGGGLSGLLTATFGTLQPFGLEGWRCTMIVGAIGSFAVAALILSLLPESPRWLFAQGRRAEAEASFRRLAGLTPGQPVPDFGALDAQAKRAAAADPSGEEGWTTERRLMLAFFLLLAVVLPWSLTTFPMLSGAIFTQRGYDTEQALLLHSAVVMGVSAGSILNFLVVDRIARDKLLICIALFAVLSTVLFGISSSPVVAIVAGLGIVAGVSSYQQTLLLYCAEQFPPLLRAKVPGLCFGVSRGLATIVPLVMLPLLLRAGEGPVLVVIGSSMLISALLLLTRRLRRSPVRGADGLPMSREAAAAAE